GGQVAARREGEPGRSLRAREERRGVARRLDDLPVLAGQLQQPASRPLPQTAAPRTRDPQADRRHEPQGTHHRAARVVFQGRHRQGGDRARQGEEAARQARGPEASSRGAGAGPSHADAARMIPLACLLLIVAPPQVVIVTPRGETIVPIATERGSSAVAAPLLARPLGLSAALEGSRATVALGGAIFVFQLGAPFVRAGGVVYGLVGEPYVARDTLFLPLHWLADCVPRAEPTRRGIAALLTRTSDTLIDLADRGASCRAECDLFVSIHVNAMPAGRSVERTSGVETYFLSDAKTEDQERVAKMENDALRFESTPTGGSRGPVDFILKDLQLNEYLRESARLAELVQDKAVAVHPGGDRG